MAAASNGALVNDAQRVTSVTARMYVAIVAHRDRTRAPRRDIDIWRRAQHGAASARSERQAPRRLLAWRCHQRSHHHLLTHRGIFSRAGACASTASSNKHQRSMRCAYRHLCRAVTRINASCSIINIAAISRARAVVSTPLLALIVRMCAYAIAVTAALCATHLLIAYVSWKSTRNRAWRHYRVAPRAALST